MAITDYFHDKATIQRKTVSRGSSGEVINTWADHKVAIPCRLVVQDQRVASSQGLLMITTYRLLIGASLDVTDQDMVEKVLLDDNRTEGPFTIESVLPRRGAHEQNHMTLKLEKVA